MKGRFVFRLIDFHEEVLQRISIMGNIRDQPIDGASPLFIVNTEKSK